MARPMKPLAVIMGNGNSAHLTKEKIREREKNEIKVDTDNVEAPCYLSEEQAAKFNYLKDELLKVGLVSNLDVDLLARYVTLNDQYIKITKMITNTDILIAIDGEEIYNPKYKELLNAQTKITKEIRGIANDLGLTVGARLKLTIPKPQKEEKKEQSEGEKLFGDII